MGSQFDVLRLFQHVLNVFEAKPHRSASSSDFVDDSVVKVDRLTEVRIFADKQIASPPTVMVRMEDCSFFIA